MSTYVIGDIHGCFDQFTKLLKKINYKKDEDKLILLGDLVNRGPDSLSVINHCMADSNIITVLGNHDLYLLYLLSIDKAKGKLKEVVESNNNKKIFFHSMLFNLYQFLWYLFLPVALMYFFYRSLKEPGYASDLSERLSFCKKDFTGACWCHAVSLGEVRAARPVFRKLLLNGEKLW